MKVDWGGERHEGREATFHFADKENETQRIDVIYSSQLLRGKHGINNPES